MKERGVKIPIEGWWVALAREFIQKDQHGRERNSTALDELGKDLARAQGRAEPWSRTALQRVVRGDDVPTLELAEALCRLFPRLPPPVYFPRSLQESLRMAGIKESYDGHEPGDSDAPVGDLSARVKRRAARVTAHGQAKTPPAKTAKSGR